MTDQQPTALRLAECLDEPDYCTLLQMRQAAAELRQLWAANELLKNINAIHESRSAALRDQLEKKQ